MIDAQQDKASNGRTLRRTCNRQKILKCCGLPRKLSDAGDDEILAFASKQNRLLVTWDRTIAEDWPHCFANGCPGVLIVSFGDETLRHMTEAAAITILREFKAAYPEWHDIPCTNSIIELQPKYIFVNHFEGNSVRTTGYVDRSDPDWRESLHEFLAANAMRVY